MQKTVFVVLGYGVPRDIFKDDNYRFYLNTVFNQIFDIIQEKPTDMVHIVFSGGPTDCFKPYRRTEAREMERYFAMLCKRPAVRAGARSWRLHTENKALSTLENLLFTKELLTSKRITTDRTVIFCERLRLERVFLLAQTVFGKAPKAIVTAIDFDVSERRYETADTRRREQFVLHYDLWALSDPKNLKPYHTFYQEKIAFLRKQPAAIRSFAGKKWWEEKFKTLPQA